MNSYLSQLSPAFTTLAEEIGQIPDSNGVIKRHAGKLLPEIAKSIQYHVFKALPPLIEGSMATTSISLDKNHYSPSNEYNTDAFKYVVHIERAFFKLVDSGYIQIVTKGWQNRTTGRSDNTKYRLTAMFKQWLVKQLDEIGFNSNLYTLVVDPLLIPREPLLRVQSRNKDDLSLREPRTEKLHFKTSPETENITSDLCHINKLLSKTWVDLDLTKPQWEELKRRLAEHKKKDKPTFIRYNNRQLYRVFNDTKFSTGGRYYGGWWESIPNNGSKGTQFRRHLVINGKATVEIDYSGLHPAILYAKEGMTLPQDPYTPILGKKYRDVSKRILNAFINSKQDMKSGPRNLKFRFDDQTLTWGKIKERVNEIHAPISKYFCTGAGMWLMYEDSLLATKVMHHFAKYGIPCLPVHDSFIMHHGYENELRDKMNEFFEERYGVKAKIKNEEVIFFRDEKDFNAKHALEDVISGYELPQEHRLYAFRTLLNK